MLLPSDDREVRLDDLNSMAAEGWRVASVDWSDRHPGRMLAALMERDAPAPLLCPMSGRLYVTSQAVVKSGSYACPECGAILELGSTFAGPATVIADHPRPGRRA